MPDKEERASADPSGEITPVELGPNDVLCDIGRTNHPGTKYYHEQIRKYWKDFYAGSCNKKKKLVFESIADSIYSRKPPGRFLKRDSRSDLWYELSREDAVSEAGRCLIAAFQPLSGVNNLQELEKIMESDGQPQTRAEQLPRYQPQTQAEQLPRYQPQTQAEQLPRYQPQAVNWESGYRYNSYPFSHYGKRDWESVRGYNPYPPMNHINYPQSGATKPPPQAALVPRPMYEKKECTEVSAPRERINQGAIPAPPLKSPVIKPQRAFFARKITQESTKPFVEPAPNDVLGGHGSGLAHHPLSNHPGTKYYRDLVRNYAKDYIHSSDQEKEQFPAIIVHAIHTRSSPGRFLKQAAKSKLWYEINHQDALTKVKQNLNAAVRAKEKDLAKGIMEPHVLCHSGPNHSARTRQKSNDDGMPVIDVNSAVPTDAVATAPAASPPQQHPIQPLFIGLDVSNFTRAQIETMPIVFAYTDQTHELARKSQAALIQITKKRKSTVKPKGVPAKEIYNGPAEDLPTGWTLIIQERMGGKSKGNHDRYWISPKTKKRMRSQTELKRFLEALESVGGDEELAWNMAKAK